MGIVQVEAGQCVLPMVAIVPEPGEQVSFVTYDFAVGETEFAGIVEATGSDRARVRCGPEQVFSVPLEMISRPGGGRP